MKKFLIRSAVFIITFLVTLVVASRILNKDRDNLTMEMAEATLPVLNMLCDDTQYNRLYGYCTPMEYALFRDNITLLGENRSVSFLIRSYGRTVTRIGAELRSEDGQRLIESLELDNATSKSGELPVKFTLKDLIEKDQEYLLVINLELDGWEKADYYTRVIWKDDSHLTEDLEFVKNFHEKLYSREAAKDLVKYLESNSRLESNSSFHKVNIHSSFKQITWGDLKVTETVAPSYTLKELTSQSASILLDYQVSTKGTDDVVTYYRMQEYFRVKYTPDRMYLLDYERTMTQIPSEKDLYGGDKILLGIGDENVDMLENADGSVLAFQQADRLFSYQNHNQKLALLFAFYDIDVIDERNDHNEHDLKILRVDDDGNVFFAVYGYMNRGDHEGEVGICVYKYDVGVNTIEEISFLSWKKPYSNLKAQMKELLFLNEDGMMYLNLDQSVYRLDLETQSWDKLLEKNWDGGMRISADHRILVWQNQEADREIRVRDLSADTQTVLKGNVGEALKIMGFMGEDIIYGAARRSQIRTENSGQVFFPVYRLFIARADGTILKEYAQEGIYVTDCAVEDNQIVLERVQEKEDGSFSEIGQDHITRTSQSAVTRNTISVVDIDLYERYVQIKVSGKIDTKMVQFLTPKQIVHEGYDVLEPETAPVTECYYTYGPYGVEEICLSAGPAVNLANEIAGTVLNQNGDVVWQKGGRSSRNQIMAIKEPEKSEAGDSLAVCLDTMLRNRGITVNSSLLLEKGKKPLEILNENMTNASAVDMKGCVLDALLYFVDRDIPILALLNSGEAVLITGFNESQVVVFQPSTGKLYKRGMSDASKWFEENGNSFITLLPDA